ncbi:disulfide bond formation protein B [Denitromonas iodatirespirans]|uniref:Disulfide bond formation protein B n=1 Tax=Denitromonas iodatirespirans TaxID=2795389 RepID=A0A944H819_DENI1|nr:disulfide bond formation protein B [Denitromonas iodatirespirans]MBT0960910.1 disulfide bond formation protein B [Denitromonas iodatirespirans]
MLSLLDRPRLPFFALFLVGSGLLGFGLYLQHVVGLEPCPMCIMQRYAFAVATLFGLVGGLHGSTGSGRKVYGALITLFALAGGGVAAWQSWMQRFPPNLAECGPGIEYLMESFPLTELLPMIFRGAGDCTAIDWTFLGLSIANWSLLSFTAVLAFGLHVIFRRVAPR